MTGPYYAGGKWIPDCTKRQVQWRPEPGWLIAKAHAVWELVAVEDVPWTAADRTEYERHRSWARGRLTPETWTHRPFRADAKWVGGVKPEWVTEGRDTGSMVIRPGSRHSASWETYPYGRWPRCSCCGEPMPCRAAITDARVDVELAKMSKFEGRMPGSCWSCGDPVTSRQRSVAYGGMNLDMPGGPTVRFHAKASCRYDAERYEYRWLEDDPGRLRMLTWPYCRGCLYWHNDDTSECVGGRADCEGHATHRHGYQAGCSALPGGCPRGCDPRQSHCRGRNNRNPWLRPPDLPQGGDRMRLVGGDTLEAESDGRPPCPGTLLVHADGSEVCTRGGLDDCWDGSKYSHAERRDCASQSHGCPTCEATEGLS